MADTKYGKYLITPEIKNRPGRPPFLEFLATQHGIDAHWIVDPVTGITEEGTSKKTREIHHSHDHHQFVSFFGSNAYNIAEFDAAIPVSLGEEGEEHIITRPTVLHLPPGLIHGSGKSTGRVGKPYYHLDMSFTPEYRRTELATFEGKPSKDTASQSAAQTAGTKYGKYLTDADIRVRRDGENPSLMYSVVPLGIECRWVVVPATKVVDEKVRTKLLESSHSHTHHQFITFFGSNPYDIREFGAEISICLGEEREEHIIDKPTVFHIPPGLLHGSGSRPKKVDKPYFTVDTVFTPEYKRMSPEGVRLFQW